MGWLTKIIEKFTWNRYVRNIVRETIESVVSNTMSSMADTITSITNITDLQKKVNQLEIEKSGREEEFARREREVEHKVGLERKRQEFEINQTKRTTEVSIREENLKADKERFKAEMEFQRKHLEGEIQSLRDLVGQLMQRLPSAEIIADISVSKRR